MVAAITRATPIGKATIEMIGNCFFKVLFRGVGPAGFEGVQTIGAHRTANLWHLIEVFDIEAH